MQLALDLHYTHYNAYTGEVIVCKKCDSGASAFIGGLWPVCADHWDSWISYIDGMNTVGVSTVFDYLRD